MQKSTILHHISYTLLIITVIIVFTLPAYAETLRLKGGYASFTNNVSAENGYMASLEYCFTPYMGLTGQIEAYNPSIGAGTTATTNIYYAFATFHAFPNPDDYKEIALLSLMTRTLSPYAEVGYAFLNYNTIGAIATNGSNNGISYAIGFDILPQSNICGFVGYRWLTLPSNGGIAYLIAGLNAGLEIKF